MAAVTLFGFVFSLKAGSDVEDYLQTYGWLVGSQSGLVELQLSESEAKDVIAGMKTAAEGEALTVDLHREGPNFERYLTNRSVKVAEAAAAGKAADIPAATGEEKKYLEMLGWLVGQRANLPSLSLDAAETAAFAGGIDDALNGRPVKLSPEENRDAIQLFLSERINATTMAAAQVNIAAGAEKTAELQASPEYKTTDSGLIYRIIEPGDGRKPAATDTVRVHYTGKLLDGTVFDSSVARGQPISFGLNQVIPGWTEGMQLIGEGGEIELFIPYNLGYGEGGNPPAIPPGSMIHFNVQLLGIQ